MAEKIVAPSGRAQDDLTGRLVTAAKRAVGDLAHRDVSRAEAALLEAKVCASLDLLAKRARIAPHAVEVAREATSLLRTVSERNLEAGAS